MKRATASAVRAQKPSARQEAARPRRRELELGSRVPNHVRAAEREAIDPAAAVELGRSAPRVTLPHASAVRALFGDDVRLARFEVHAGNAARIACDVLEAQAFAVKNVLVFGEERPALSRVLHEVAHALQQGGDREAAPARFSPGSLGLGAPGSAAECQAQAFAAGRRVPLSHAPLGVYRDTGYAIADTEQRLGKMMQSGEWQVKDYGPDPEQARFAVTADTKDKKKIFRYSGPKPWRRGDLQRAAAVNGDASASIEQASKDIDNIFKANPTAPDSIAQKGITISGIVYRICKVDTKPPGGILSLYAFIGGAYASNAQYPATVVDRLRGETTEVDPGVKLSDYVGILEAVIKQANKLKKDATLVDGVQKVIDTIKKTLTEDLATAELAERLSNIRADMTSAIIKLYPDLDELHDNVIASSVFGKYTSLQGRIFEEWYLATYGKKYALVEQPIFGEKLGDKVVKSDALHKLRRGDFALAIKGKYFIKELKALSSPRDPNDEEQLQMQDYKTIFEKKIPGYFEIDGKLESRVFKGVEYEFSNQPRVETATLWVKFLDKHLGAKWYKTVPNPKAAKKVKPKVKGKKSPTLVFTIEDSDKLVHDFDESQLNTAETKRPGLSLKSAHIELAYERDPRIKSGTFKMDVDMGKQVSKEGDVKAIEPRPEEANENKDPAPKAAANPTAPDGYFEVKVDKMGSTLDKMFSRLETDADITDEGLVATLRLKPGESGIPGFVTTEGTEIRATLNASKFDLQGAVAIKHKTRDITGNITIAWDSGSRVLKVVGTASAKKLVPIVDEITLRLSYVTAPEPKWDIKVVSLDATKKIGPVTLNASAKELSFDGEAGGVTAENVALKASMPALGEITASAAIKNNEVTDATFTYESARFFYPKSAPVIDGEVKGTVLYSKGKFSGGIEGDAKIKSAALKKLGNLDALSLKIKAGFDKDENFSGTIGTDSVVQLGDYFRLSGINGTLNSEGEVSVSLTVELVNIKLSKIKLDDAKLTCTISRRGFQIDDVAIKLTFGDPAKDRASGTLFFTGKGNEFVVGASVDVLVKKGLLAHGDITYDTAKRQANGSLSLKSPDNPEGKIQLLSFKPNAPKKLFGLGPKQFVLFFIYVGGMYIEFEFELLFDYGLDFWVKPTLFLTGLDFGTMSFASVSAEMWMGGDLTASLAAVPRVAVGLFLGHPKLLRGGGGLSFEIKAVARLTPSGMFHVEYARQANGEYAAAGNARLALAMTFGITADLFPDAEFVVLDGVYRAKWKGDSLASFILLPPRELFTYVVDFGKPLAKEENPALPKGSNAPSPTSAKETQTSELTGDKKKAKTPEADAEAQEKEGAKGENATGKEEGFSISGMLAGLLDKPVLKAIKELIDAAVAIFGALAKIVRFLVDLVKNWVGDALEAVKKFLKGVADAGGLFKYLKAFLKERVNASLFYVIEPMLDMFADKEEKFMTLIGRPLPSSFSGWASWTIESVQLILDLSWGSLPDFVDAVWTMAKRFTDVLGHLLDALVQTGKLGAKRTKYDFGLTTKWIPDEWQIPIGGGDVLQGYNPLPVLNPLSTGVAAPLYGLLEQFKDVHYTDDGPEYSYWRKEKPYGASIAPGAKAAVRRAARTSYGVPLPADLAEKYQKSLGADLSEVRLHMDDAAAQAADALNARAYTVGRDIYFNHGEYAPRTVEGERLLAHEVVHAAEATRRACTEDELASSLHVAGVERHADALGRALVATGPTREFSARPDERRTTHADALRRALA